MTTLEYYNTNAEKLKARFPTLMEFGTPLNERNLPMANTMDYLLPKITPESSFLDVGCGWGAFSDYLPSSVKYTGIDNSKAMLSFATPKENATFIQDDLHLLPFEDNSFDYILANESLNYANVENAHREIHRVLKPEGKFYSKMWLLSKPIDEVIPPSDRDAFRSLVGLENDVNVFGIQDVDLYESELSKFFNHQKAGTIEFAPQSVGMLTTLFSDFNSFKEKQVGWAEDTNNAESIANFKKNAVKLFAPNICAWSMESFFVGTKK